MRWEPLKGSLETLKVVFVLFVCFFPTEKKGEGRIHKPANPSIHPAAQLTTKWGELSPRLTQQWTGFSLPFVVSSVRGGREVCERTVSVDVYSGLRNYTCQGHIDEEKCLSIEDPPPQWPVTQEAWPLLLKCASESIRAIIRAVRANYNMAIMWLYNVPLRKLLLQASSFVFTLRSESSETWELHAIVACVGCNYHSLYWQTVHFSPAFV